MANISSATRLYNKTDGSYSIVKLSYFYDSAINMRSCLLFCLLVFAPSLFAQQRYGQFYDIENLFSQELIKAVVKDDEGFIWIATDKGVLRYDGFETKFFKELPNAYTKAFLKRKDGSLYVLHDSGIKEIVKQQDSIFFRPLTLGEKVYDIPLNYPKAVYEDIDGNLWIGELNAILRVSERGFKRYDLGEGFRSINYHRTFSFAEDAFGNLWIAPFKGPLLYYDKDSQELTPVDIPYTLTDVCSITSVRGDYLLVGGKEGLLKLKVDSDKNILDSQLISEIKDISVIINLSKTEVYIGTWTNGLFYGEISGRQNAFEKLNAPLNDVVGLFMNDAKDELWVAGSEYVGLLRSSPVSTLRQTLQNRIESLTIDGQNNLYYSIGGQVFYLGLQSSGPREILSANDTYFARILVEGNRLWVGDAFGRVSYYDLQRRSFHTILPELNASIQYVYRDHAGNKWFTGHTGGLIRVNAGSQLKFYNKITASVVTRESKTRQLYCGRNGKSTLLSRYDSIRDEFVTIDLEYQFPCPDNIILNDFQIDSSDNIWLATEEGLLKMQTENGAYKRVERIQVSGFEENEPVKSIAISNGFVCLGNASGLAIYKDGECIVFDQDSGLPSRILKERGLIFDKNGDLLVSTAKGIAVFKKELIEFTLTVRPAFKTVLVNGVQTYTEEGRKYTFPYKTRLEAEFISLSYPASNLVYQTKISGVDKDWSTPSSSRNINILGVSEGAYVLQVRAREDGKLWSEPLTFHFTISKPWYRTWWAVTLFLITAIAGVATYVKAHNNHLVRQKKILEKIVDERTREVDRQKNELIEQQTKIIQQKQEIIEKNEAVFKSQQALTEADMNYLHLKEKQLQEQVDYKNKQVTTHALNIIQKNETLRDLRNKLEEIVKKPDRLTVAELRKTLRIIDDSFKLDKDWDDFKLYFEQVHTGFYSKLKINYPDLTTQELRHCALIRLNLTIAECASVLGISHDSMKVSRTRLRKKLHLEPNQSLTDFILGL